MTIPAEEVERDRDMVDAVADAGGNPWTAIRALLEETERLGSPSMPATAKSRACGRWWRRAMAACRRRRIEAARAVHDPKFEPNCPEYAVYWAILHSSGFILPRLKVERPAFAEEVAALAVKGLRDRGWLIERVPPRRYGPMP